MLLSRAGFTSSFFWISRAIQACGALFLCAGSRRLFTGSWSAGSICSTRSATRSLLTMSICVAM